LVDLKGYSISDFQVDFYQKRFSAAVVSPKYCSVTLCDKNLFLFLE